MPSSPESTLAARAASVELPRWEPVELSGVADVVAPAAAAPAFTRVLPGGGRPAPAPFEIAGAGAVPDAVLLPARRAAEAAGYAAGYTRGLAAARSVVVEQAMANQARDAEVRAAAQDAAERAVAALTSAARRLATEDGHTLERAQDTVVDTAFALAECLVGSVLADDTLRGRAVVGRLMGAVATETGPVTVHLSPADLQVAASLITDPSVLLVADDTLALGDATATTDLVTVEAGLLAGLARVREALGR